MNIYCFTSIFSFIHNSLAYVEITGELTFDVQPVNANRENDARIRDYKNPIAMKIHTDSNRNTTIETPPAVDADVRPEDSVKVDRVKEECVYKYPDKKQMEALLSGMMNQLTKIFVRAYDYIGGREPRRSDKRFRIVTKKFNSSFFEQAYNLMTREYRHSINITANEAKFLSHDPCHHQSDIKQIWRNLLDHSKAILKRAAVRCVSDFLRLRNRAEDSRTKEKLGQLLLREIKEVRSNQLKVLCDDFKLCYKDLLI